MKNFWYEYYPAILSAELEVLKNGISNFIFIDQAPLAKTNGEIIITGVLILDSEQYQIIRIKYPASYPFSPALIYPLHGSYNKETGEIQIGMVQTNLGLRETVTFGKGNQYRDDRMCLFKEEDNWTPFVDGISMVLQQSVEWLKIARSDKPFAKSVIVEEDNPHAIYTGQLLFYEPAEMPENCNGGNLLVKQFKENFYVLIQASFVKTEEEQSITINCFPDDQGISDGKEEVIIGKWFSINGEAKEVIPQLLNAEIFNQFLINNGIQINSFLKNPTSETKRIIIGFRFGDERIFHCFQILYWRLGNDISFQINYLLPKNLKNELFARVNELFNPKILFSKTVMIIGLGAIGSEVAKELSSCNLGNFILIDDDTLDVGNVMRHAGDLNQIGEPKVGVVKKIILGKNPKATVHAIKHSLFYLKLPYLLSLVQKSDLIIDCTANKLVESYLHQYAFKELNKPVIQSAVSKGGMSGVILAMIPGRSACINCLAEVKLDYVPVSNLDTEILKNTKPDFGACSQPALPATGLDTRSVAIQTSRVILQALIEKESTFYPKLTGYQYYWHGVAGSKTHKPFEWQIEDYRSQNCESCKK